MACLHTQIPSPTNSEANIYKGSQNMGLTYPRHLNIHQNQVNFLLLFLQCWDGFRSTRNTTYRCPILWQHQRCNSSVDKIIINLHIWHSISGNGLYNIRHCSQCFVITGSFIRQKECNDQCTNPNKDQRNWGPTYKNKKGKDIPQEYVFQPASCYWLS